MARPRKFSPEYALGAAMHAFWSHGFHGAPFDLLVKKTGASRHGLYQEFGDKDRLLLLSLQHYEKTVLGELVEELHRDEAALPELRHFFQRIAQIARFDSDGAGCLICNTQLEMPEQGPVHDHIGQFFERLRTTFLRCLERARQKGQLENEKDVNALSHYLVGLVHSISANAQSNPSDEAYEAYVEIALSVFGCASVKLST
ncbi:MAG: TetR/AcrR family transcriptional regulator [Candidatus Thiodiazotropha taylori]